MSGPAPVATRAVPTECAACRRPLDSPAYCEGCRRVYPCDGLDLFALLGVPARYDVDPQRLRDAYFRLARVVHPDRTAALSPEQRETATRLSAKINQAVQVLSAPALRAAYLLEHFGGASAASDKTVPDAVLAETLEQREAIDDAKAAGDVERLGAIRERLLSAHGRLTDEMSVLARRLPGDDDTRASLRVTLNSLKYYERMLEQT